MSFEKKFWENGDEVFPRDLNRYEDGIEELYVNGEQLSLDVGEFDTRIEQNTNQIQIFSSERGYLNIKLLSSINEITDSGKYRVVVSGHTIIPNAIYLVDATQYGTISVQKFTAINNNIYDTYSRVVVDGIEKHCKRVATEDEMNVLNDRLTYVGLGENGTSSITTNSNTISSSGMYQTNVNTVGTNFISLLDHRQFDVNYAYQFLQRFGTQDLEYRIKNGGSWGSIKKLATTEKMDISFPYASGYTARSGWISRVTKTQDNIVIIEAGLNKTDGTAFPTTETFIGNLPVGYRPIENLLVQSSATFFGGADSKFVGIVNVKSSGSVYIDTMGKNAIGCGFVFQFNGGA